jgi:pimeloyl-ACP methyl ester carboxylesterase
VPAPITRRPTLRGLRFRYLDWGIAGAPPLLLLHGAAQTAHSFDEVAPGLARDHHVVAADQRGHGDTDWAARYRRDDYVGDIAALLDHLGWWRATLVAMSLGGLNALSFATTYPGRVAGLVVVDVVPTIVKEGRDAVGKQLAVRDFGSFDEAVAHAHAFNPRRSLENIRERLGHAMRARPDGRWTYKFDPGVAREAEVGLPALWHRIASIRRPVLLVRGAESAMLAAEGAERFRRTIPGSVVATVPGAGHSVMGDNPAGFLAAVRPFLARHDL